MLQQKIIDAIDNSPMNRGLSGADWLADPDNLAIAIGEDIGLFEREAPGVYQFHWLTSSRGRQAIECTGNAFGRLFREHDAKLIFGLVSVDRRDAKLMARWVGAKHVGNVMTDCGECEIFLITKEMFEGGKP